MSYVPSIIALDYETSGLDFWSPDFRILSCALAWRGPDGSLKTRYVSKDNLESTLLRLAVDKIPIVVHNYGFEYGVSQYHASCIKDLIAVDTMRLSQVFDNGGHEYHAQRGFGLAKCAQRILGRPDHKLKFYDWLRTNKDVRKGQEGANLDLLPPELFEEYNVADAVETLLLYEFITSEFKTIGYNWELDHSLYLATSKNIVAAQAKGIAVNRDKLLASLEEVKRQIANIDAAFRERFKTEIGNLEDQWQDSYVNAVKTAKAQEKRRLQSDAWQFNPKSAKHLEALFVGELGIKPKFFTPKRRPSFKGSHLPTYGEGGEILANRNSKLLLKQQIESLLNLSENDARWHLTLKTAGTSTGRFAGGSLNG